MSRLFVASRIEGNDTDTFGVFANNIEEAVGVYKSKFNVDSVSGIIAAELIQTPEQIAVALGITASADNSPVEGTTEASNEETL